MQELLELKLGTDYKGESYTHTHTHTHFKITQVNFCCCLDL